MVNSGNFTWHRASPSVLENINLKVRKGKLVAIIGQVGSGKSSLLRAIAGEMYKCSGNVGISVGFDCLFQLTDKQHCLTFFISREAWLMCHNKVGY